MLTYPNAWLASQLPKDQVDSAGRLAPFILPPWKFQIWSRPAALDDQRWASGFLGPQLCAPARRLLELSRLTEYLLKEIFLGEAAAPQEPASQTRTERANRERIDRVKAALAAELDRKFSLEELAEIAGCSPHHLSRNFTQLEGKSLSLWLRGVRIDKAAELLVTGACNVSEAALEVGYRSFSHFSRAFFEEKGQSPSRWGRES
jgi:AraC-like DNA-binding protein